MNHMTADVSWAPWNEQSRKIERKLNLKFIFDCIVRTSVETNEYENEDDFEYSSNKEKEGLMTYSPESMMQDLSAYLKRDIESCKSESKKKDLKKKLCEIGKFEFKIIEVEMEGME